MLLAATAAATLSASAAPASLPIPLISSAASSEAETRSRETAPAILTGSAAPGSFPIPLISSASSSQVETRSRETAAATQNRLPNGWRYEEPGNHCLATRTAGGSFVQLRLTRWNDLSDSILFHRPGLPPLWSEEGLPTGRTAAEEEADAEAGYRLEVRIDGRPVEGVLAFSSMILDYDGRPGPTYRFGIRQQPFIRALRTGRSLSLHHRGRRLATFLIRGSASMADRMAACVDRPVR